MEMILFVICHFYVKAIVFFELSRAIYVFVVSALPISSMRLFIFELHYSGFINASFKNK